MFSGYIPTSNIFSSNDMEQFMDNSKAMMTVQVLDLSGALYPIKNVDTFTVQHNPALLNDPEVKANYASHTGLGNVQEQNHYLNTTRGEVSFSLILTDTYEGPPHSRVEADGTVVRQDFNNLFEATSWFKNLATVITAWQKPPYVRVSLGRQSTFGFVKTVGVQWLKLQRNGEANICRVDFTVKPDQLNYTNDTEFYRVK